MQLFDQIKVDARFPSILTLLDCLLELGKQWNAIVVCYRDAPVCLMREASLFDA